MRKIETIQELQKIEYDILCSTIDFFEENDIRYLLCGGTMLGAVRHNGFIPWDDDIDVLVPREDYEKLKGLRDVFDHQNIKLRIPGDENYPFPFIKVVNTQTILRSAAENSRFPSHIWIDIFPLDHFPDNKIAHMIELAKNKVLRGALHTEILTNGPAHGGKLMKLALTLVNKMLGGYQKIAVKMDLCAKAMNDRNIHSKHYGDGAWPNYVKDYFDDYMIFPFVKHMFVDREFNIPKNYDAYLTRFYGDYMTPPSKEHQITHCFDAYWIE